MLKNDITKTGEQNLHRRILVNYHKIIRDGIAIGISYSSKIYTKILGVD